MSEWSQCIYYNKMCVRPTNKSYFPALLSSGDKRVMFQCSPVTLVRGITPANPVGCHCQSKQGLWLLLMEGTISDAERVFIGGCSSSEDEAALAWPRQFLYAQLSIRLVSVCGSPRGISWLFVGLVGSIRGRIAPAPLTLALTPQIYIYKPPFWGVHPFRDTRLPATPTGPTAHHLQSLGFD